MKGSIYRRAAFFLLALFVSSCTAIAPFDTRERPDSGTDADGDSDSDGDSDGDGDGDSDGDSDSDGDADQDMTDSDTPCAPACSETNCTFDGCGVPCLATTCGPDQACAITGECVDSSAALWVFIPAGEFQMGSPEDEYGRAQDADYVDETRHRVGLSNSFVIYSTEVTQTDYATLVEVNPSLHLAQIDGRSCAECPVDNLTWHDAAVYTNLYSESRGLPPCYVETTAAGGVSLDPIYPTIYDCPGFRLPSEAEWEYAVRAGTQTPIYIDEYWELFRECEVGNPLDEIAWYDCNATNSEHVAFSFPVAQLRPNSWGLFDMLGNAFEWCDDWFGDYPVDDVENPVGRPEFPEDLIDSRKISRGAGGSMGSYRVRAAKRFAGVPGTKHGFSGVRLVRTVTPATLIL